MNSRIALLLWKTQLLKGDLSDHFARAPLRRSTHGAVVRDRRRTDKIRSDPR